MVVILYVRIPVTSKYSSIMHKGYQKMYGYLSDAMTNIANVKQTGSKRHEGDKIEKGFKEGASRIFLENQRR
jgi:hypothetical protein